MFRKKRTKSPKAERPPGPLKSAFQKLKAKFRGKQTPSETSDHHPPLVEHFSETLATESGLILPPPIPPKTKIPISVSYDPFTGFWTFINLETQVIVPAPPGSHARGNLLHFAVPSVPPVPVDPRFVMPVMQLPEYRYRSQLYLMDDESGARYEVPGRPSAAVRRAQDNPPGMPLFEKHSGKSRRRSRSPTQFGVQSRIPGIPSAHVGRPKGHPPGSPLFGPVSKSRSPITGHSPTYENVTHHGAGGRTPVPRSRRPTPKTRYHPKYKSVRSTYFSPKAAAVGETQFGVRTSAVPVRPGPGRRPQYPPPGSPLFEKHSPSPVSKSQTVGYRPVRYESVTGAYFKPDYFVRKSPVRSTVPVKPHHVPRPKGHPPGSPLFGKHSPSPASKSGRRSRSPIARPGTSKSDAIGRRPSSDSEETQL